MTTADRIDPIGYRSWAPAAGPAVVTDDYVGRHRKTGMRTFSLHRMLYTARHAARTR